MTTDAKKNISSIQWIAAHNGEIPGGALPAGTEDDKPLYICRAYHGGSQHPGKIRSDFKGCHIPWGGEEVVIPSYEVLVVQEVAMATTTTPDSSAVAIKVYVLSDLLTDSQQHGLFLQNEEKTEVREAAIEIRNLALASGALDLVEQAERLKELTTENLPDREDAVNLLNQMKKSATTHRQATA